MRPNRIRDAHAPGHIVHMGHLAPRERQRCALALGEVIRACDDAEALYERAAAFDAARSYRPVFQVYASQRALFSERVRAAELRLGGAIPYAGPARTGDIRVAWFGDGSPSVLVACETAEGLAASACLRALSSPLPADVYETVASQLEAIVLARRHLRMLREFRRPPVDPVGL